MTAGAILCGFACGLLYIALLFVVALALGSMISRADRDAEAIDRAAQDTAEADEIALSIQFGGASTFQHNDGGAR